jgi:hypothetical protein
MEADLGNQDVSTRLFIEEDDERTHWLTPLIAGYKSVNATCANKIMRTLVDTIQRLIIRGLKKSGTRTGQ